MLEIISEVFIVCIQKDMVYCIAKYMVQILLELKDINMTK